MQRKMLIGKIHRATVTEANLAYQGSISIDENLMEAAGILEFEQVEVWNITNGNRFSTYAMEAPKGSGVVCINGAAAHKASPGDLVIIAHFAWVHESEVHRHKPKVVLVDEKNQPVGLEPPVRTLRVMNMLM
ncbi:MAG: aspartate 1-decarboxylase [bacterium]